MKAEKIRNSTEVELKHQERDLADQLFKLKFQMNMGQTESLKKIRGLRRDIARVQTVQREQELAARKTETGKTALGQTTLGRATPGKSMRSKAEHGKTPARVKAASGNTGAVTSSKSAGKSAGIMEKR